MGSYSQCLLLPGCQAVPAAPPGTAAGGLRTCPTGAGLTLAILQPLSDPAEVCGGSLPLGRAGQRGCWGCHPLTGVGGSSGTGGNPLVGLTEPCVVLELSVPSCPYTLPVWAGCHGSSGLSSVQGWLLCSCQGWGWGSLAPTLGGMELCAP